ncbi:tetratricopeptide repeat protein [Natronoflexus pectinivorans]|uniref:Tetratricopeptide repeat protein n=1 Tax=Natronoflexus pectinivorans TaxID=682526 RepID=A0A4R2GIX4_9BACT|nr:tetratricopeptide repeat protein [Natronoflexus pectinivorans]TCO08243.1 tetratricopeptide repeat protein [Natronoflexus pectinivorans]
MINEDKIFKYLTKAFLAISLPAMLVMALDAGISGDEYFHLNQAEAVVNWYYSCGSDTTALHTPVTNLKYYGQGFDNAASLVARIFNIDDIFTIRHLMNAVAGWLIFLFIVLLAFTLGGWRAAFFAVLLCVLSPRLIGHSFNNLKDVPFALGYIAGIYFLIRWMKEWPSVSKKTLISMMLTIAFTISIRPPGLILIGWLFLITFLMLIHGYLLNRTTSGVRHSLWVKTLWVAISGYLLGLLFWPFALMNPIKHPIISHLLMEAYPVTIRQLFMGEMIWSDMLPWFYLPWMMLISITFPVLAGFLLFFFSGFWKSSKKRLFFGFIVFTIFFPLLYIIFKESNVYGGWRHVLFIYPPMVVLSAIGISRLWQFLKIRKAITARAVVAALLLISMIHPIKFMALNHPFQYLYFNQLTGGYKGAFGKYEADYYFHTIRPAAEWLNDYINETGEEDLIIASNFETAWFFRNNDRLKEHRQTSWYNRSFENWDYAIFSATYLHAFNLSPKQWPPSETIHKVYVDGMPVCVVLKRETLYDYLGWKALKERDFFLADSLLNLATDVHPGLEGAWLNLARARHQLGDYHSAINALDMALEIHPTFEPALMEYARISFALGNPEMALNLLNRLTGYNKKYLPAYTLKAEYLIALNRQAEALDEIKKCLKIQPSWMPARELFLELTEY